MPRTTILLTTVVVCELTGCTSRGQATTDPGAPDLPSSLRTMLSPAQLASGDSLNVDFQLRGRCYAYSSDGNAEPSNGEAHSGNLARPTRDHFTAQGRYLALDDGSLSLSKDNVLLHRLYLVNRSGEATTFHAQDSRLNILPEAMDDDGDWKPIGYLPSSWCGNSYHTVILGKDEFWAFDVPVFGGTFRTKLRYVLSDGDLRLVSNSIDAHVQPTIFDPENKQGHQRTDLMDPYND